MSRFLAALVMVLACEMMAQAQSTGEEEAKKRLETLQSLPNEAAKKQFFLKDKPAALEARAIGFYSKGCLAGAKALPVNGSTWQVMRVSRNRYWGHPALIAFLEDFSNRVPHFVGWPGLLVGDLSQPRGGPMLTGHASHQIGLDADIWLTPMPERSLSLDERDNLLATNVVAPDWNDIDQSAWTPQHAKLIKLAADDSRVERVLVNWAIKKALCREAGRDHAWLAKVRPYYGHNYHMHIRLACPKSEADCRPQPPPPGDDGCGKELDWWFTDEVRNPKPAPPAPPMRVADLPPACRQVLIAP